VDGCECRCGRQGFPADMQEATLSSTHTTPALLALPIGTLVADKCVQVLLSLHVYAASGCRDAFCRRAAQVASIGPPFSGTGYTLATGSFLSPQDLKTLVDEQVICCQWSPHCWRLGSLCPTEPTTSTTRRHSALQCCEHLVCCSFFSLIVTSLPMRNGHDCATGRSCAAAGWQRATAR
jgi:hypothetical protein